MYLIFSVTLVALLLHLYQEKVRVSVYTSVKAVLFSYILKMKWASLF